jgi:hypothetical protein
MQSNASISQSLYGVYGRNNGFLLYLFLVSLFLSTLFLSQKSSFEKIIKSLFCVGVINLVYCLWVIAFGDFVGWNNQYGNILGTFGNPNFIGAFLGIFSSVIWTLIINNLRNPKIFSLLSIALALTLFEIYKSHAIQGRVLFVVGLIINLFFLIRSMEKGIWLTLTYSFFMTVIGVFGVAGTLQKGPLASFLYKDSVSLRGEYWWAGINIGKSNFWSGVGFDSYGDWYRTFRRSTSLIRPGVDTVSNTAHNVFIDIFAFGGFPLILAYLTITGLIAFQAMKFIRMNKEFDFVFVSLFGAWVCYQIQSFISINQIGLAIWGWVLGAAIVAYVRIDRQNLKSIKDNLKKARYSTKSTPELFSPGIVIFLGAILGLIISVPPLSSDMKWRAAQLSRDAQQVEEALKPSYMNPQNTFKYLNLVGAFSESGLNELAYKYTLEAVRFSPHSFETRRLLTVIPGVSAREVQDALAEMHRIDPLNPNIKAIGK